MKKSMQLLLAVGALMLCQTYVGTAEAMNGRVDVPSSDANLAIPQCSVCLEEITNPNHLLTTACRHQFCVNCIMGWFDLRTQATCPNCRASLAYAKNLKEGVNRLLIMNDNEKAKIKDGAELSKAVAAGDASAVNQWIDEHKWMQEYDKTSLKSTAHNLLKAWCTPALMVALASKKTEMALALAGFGYIQTSAQDSAGKSLIKYAIEAGDDLVMARLLKLKAAQAS